MDVKQTDDSSFPIQPPERRRTVREFLGALELFHLAAKWPSLTRKYKGNGEPVLVLPGYMTGDGSTAVLRRFLRKLGYEPHSWGLGRNHGNVGNLLPKVLERVQQVHAESEAPLRMIGWSLGGYIAREAARERPDLIQHVLTLGSPVVGGPKYTLAAEHYRKQGFDLDAMEARVAEREKNPIQVPITAIYSQNDGVVSWRACIDKFSERVEHFEVNATHVGLGFSPDVYCILAEKLSQHLVG